MFNQELLKQDFYEAVNGEYLSKLEIPQDRRSIGAFHLIDIQNEKLLLNDFKELDLNDKFVSPAMRNYLLFYRSVIEGKNTQFKADGLAQNLINQIKRIDSKKELNITIKNLMTYGFNILFNYYVYADMQDSKNNTLHMNATSIILPSKEYYQDEENTRKNLANYKATFMEIASYFGIEDAESLVDQAINLDKKIVEYVMSAEEEADITKSNNPSDLAKLQSYSELIDFGYLFEGKIKDLNKLNITDLNFYQNLNQIFNQENLAEIKAFILVKFIYQIAGLFEDDIRIKAAEFSNKLNGIEKSPEVEKYAYNKLGNLFGQVIGYYYGIKYFGEEAKKDIYRLVRNLIAMYQRRLETNPWLEEKTRKKAIEKLEKMEVMLGYPDQLEAVYDSLTYDANLSFFENYVENSKLLVQASNDEYGKAVNRTRWYMPASMVNAYFSPSNNLICFPAGILQAPFYSLNQTVSQNYGGIGAVIGHEISHAFDNNGANFDADGNLVDWWSDSDKAKFQELVNKVVELYDGKEVYGEHCNGKLTVSENIADIGGLACAYACLLEEENYDLVEFFTNFARSWAMKARPEYLKLLIKSDVHAPAKLRANITPQNLDAFFETFDIQEGDGMFLEQAKRITIW